MLITLLRSTSNVQNRLRSMIGMQPNSAGTDKGVTPYDHVHGSNTGKTTEQKLRLQFVNIQELVAQFLRTRSNDFVQLLRSILRFPSTVYMYFTSLHKSLLDDSEVMSLPEKPSDHFQIRRILHAIAMIPSQAKLRAPDSITPVKLFAATMFAMSIVALCYYSGLIALGNLLFVMQAALLIDQLSYCFSLGFFQTNLGLLFKTRVLQSNSSSRLTISFILQAIVFHLRTIAYVACCYTSGWIAAGSLVLFSTLRDLFYGMPISMHHGSALRLFISLALGITAVLIPVSHSVVLSAIKTVLLLTSVSSAILPAIVIMRTSWFKDCEDNTDAFLNVFTARIMRTSWFKDYVLAIRPSNGNNATSIIGNTPETPTNTPVNTPMRASKSPKAPVNSVIIKIAATFEDTIRMRFADFMGIRGFLTAIRLTNGNSAISTTGNAPETTTNTPVNTPMRAGKSPKSPVNSGSIKVAAFEGTIGSQPIQALLPGIKVKDGTFDIYQPNSSVFREPDVKFRETILSMPINDIDNFLKNFMAARDHHSQNNNVRYGIRLVERMLSGDCDEVVSLSSLGNDIKNYEDPIFDSFYRTLEEFFVCYFIRDMHRLLEKPNVHRFSPVFQAVTDIFDKIRLGFNPSTFDKLHGYDRAKDLKVGQRYPERSFHKINHFMLINLLDLMIMRMNDVGKDDVMYLSTYRALDNMINSFEQSKCQNNLTPQLKTIMGYIDFIDRYTTQIIGNQPNI